MPETRRRSIGGRLEDGSPAYLSPWTFEVPQIRDELANWLRGRVLNACAGETRLPYDGPVHRNDADPERPADTHHDVRNLDDRLDADPFDVVVYDPPYSQEHAERHYNDHHVGRDWEARSALEALTTTGGLVVGFAFNSDGFEGYDGWERVETVYFRTPNMSGGDVAMAIDRKVQTTLDEAREGSQAGDDE